MFGTSYFDTNDIYVTVDVSSEIGAISPYIYGINSETSLSGLAVNALKQSDPRLSSYNWETNFSNSATGQNSKNDIDLVRSYPQERWREPALFTDNLVSKAKRYGISSKYVTLQMMGMTAADMLGTVNAESGASRWDQVFFNKRDSLLSEPDTTDGAVYMDEYVSFLVNKYGYAVDGGINGYFLDNEPENWSALYPYAAARPITADELISRSAELSDSVKKIDPTALVYGPSINGIEAFINLKNPEDWEQHGQEYSWFIDYYLKGMRSASEEAGIRLLDVLDIHYHTEATNGLLEPIISGSDNFSNNTRLQAPRILWDSTYTENSTIAIMHNQHIPLIPTLEASINMYYPGTKLSFSEYNFGGGGHISGGIAVADALGIFATYGVHMACLKPNSEDTSYQKSGINIYTNYDGDGGSFGNTLVEADNGGDAMSSVYAAVDDGEESSLKMLMINKNQNRNKKAEVVLNSGADFESAEVYSFNSESADIVLADEKISVEDNKFTFEMEPLTVYMLVFDGKEADIVPEESGTQSEGSLTVGEATENSTAFETTSEKTETSAAEHEHVEAETFSSAGTTAPGTVETDTAADPNTDMPYSGQESSSGADSAAKPSADETETSADEGGGRVPIAVKVIICIFTGIVVLAMAYVVFQDFWLNRKNRK